MYHLDLFEKVHLVGTVPLILYLITVAWFDRHNRKNWTLICPFRQIPAVCPVHGESSMWIPLCIFEMLMACQKCVLLQ